ncbi:hypothetical protein LCGC14_1463990 [marine sediment metagenome]|uniref:Uncharacterized protein n=1 Tax=marine sediment metagenome TaxID=412755 RepID=A0A0F9JEA3_9ZZZZ
MRRTTDKERLDFLQSHLGEYSGKVICRKSQTSRGWRLHETLQPGAVIDVRQAIDNFMRLNPIRWRANVEQNKRCLK